MGAWPIVVQRNYTQSVYQSEMTAKSGQQQAAARRAADREAYIRKLAFRYSSVAPVDCKLNPCLALTFDDGPNPITTPQILTILERAQVHASFFVVGSRVSGNEALLKRMFADGDEIGNHSWSHPNFTTLKPEQIKEQIDHTQQAVLSAGVPAPTLFRPPYGAISPTVIENVPLAIMFWNEDPRDWAAKNPQDIEKAVLDSVRPGVVVDLHDIYHVTVDALEPLIKELKARNYQFVTASQLLEIEPGQKGEFYGRP